MPAPHAVRAIALARLDELNSSYDRFVEGDEEGLHDLRVALRRLRSWLRAFRPEVNDTLRKKTRRGLRDLADATNGARDAEVALTWIAAQTELPARSGTGRRCIVESLEHERDTATRGVKEVLTRDLPRLARRLGEQLEMYWEQQRLDHAASMRTMAPVVADVVRDHAHRAVRALARIESLDDAKVVHRARIAAKRLRYVLEPLGDRRGVDELLERLRGHQDQLGEVHDAHRLATRLVREIGERAAKDARRRALAALDLGKDHAPEKPSFASIRPGLMELARRAHAAERAAFVRFSKSCGKKERAEIEASADQIAADL